MIDVTLTFTLTLKAPFLTRSSDNGAYGLDTSMARDAEGHYCFPRKLIKGCLRQAWRELQAANEGSPSQANITKWLGDKSEKKTKHVSTVDPLRGQLLFDDFVTEATGRNESRVRIRMDDGRGSADEGAMQVIETPFGVGEEVAFAGSVRYFAKDKGESEEIRGWVDCGLRWLTNLGAMENINFGQLTHVEVEETCVTVAATTATATGGDYLDVIINPLAEFCVGQRHPRTNIFISEQIISGGVIKGALATTWLSLLDKAEAEINENTDPQRPQLGKYFSALRFTHAFPARAGTNERPVTPPLSLVKIDAPIFYDVALCEGPGLIGASPQAPSFFMDWKQSDDVIDAAFGIINPRRQLSVQTAIEKNRAKANDLYSYEKIIPNGLDWYARIDMRAIEDAQERAQVEQQLRSLLAYGLRGFGKTKSSARLKTLDGGEIQDKLASDLTPVNSQWIITLQTRALLCDPKTLNETSGSNELHLAYRAAWVQLSQNTKGDNVLDMVRYFASQTLTGGHYLYERFQKGNPYNPYLLTEAGSVFVLEAVSGREAEAAACIKRWRERGLPLPEWAIQRYARNGKSGDDWTNCPYLPENGYGEIAVNLKVHSDNAPPQGEFHAIS
jgi:hypothetical protein